MQSAGPKVIGVFLLGGLCAGLVTTLLGLVHVLFLFLSVGLIFLLGIGGGYLLCRRRDWLPAPATRGRYWGAAAVLTFCYPVAIYFGVLLAFVSEGVLWLLLPSAWYQALRAQEPMPLMAMLMLWGALIAGFMVSLALTIVTDGWDNRIFGLLLGAGILTTVVTLAFYVPVYYSTDPLITRYRESIYFAFMVPLGDTLFAGLFGWGLVRAAALMAPPREFRPESQEPRCDRRGLQSIES